MAQRSCTTRSLMTNMCGSDDIADAPDASDLILVFTDAGQYAIFFGSVGNSWRFIDPEDADKVHTFTALPLPERAVTLALAVSLDHDYFTRRLGCASQGLGFYHIDSPSNAEIEWINFKNCVVVNVRKWVINIQELEKNLNSIFGKQEKWPWQIRDLDEKKNPVRFPPWKDIGELIEFPAFDLDSEGVNIKIVEWDGDCPSLAELPVVWMSVTGIPPKKCSWKSFAQTVTSVGILMDVDLSSFFKSFYKEIRLQIACRDLVKVPKERVMEIDQKFYLLRFNVEGVDQVEEDDGFDDPTDNIVGDEGFDELEDEEETLQHMMTNDSQNTLQSNPGPANIGADKYRSCSPIPDSWEGMDLDDERLFFSSDCKSLVDDSVWDFEPTDYGKIDGEVMSQLETSVSAIYCSQVLEDYKLSDTDTDTNSDGMSSDDAAEEMDFLPNELISKIGSARKNLFPVLEQLAESSEIKKCMVVKEQKKQ
ncbi:hypothetical protein ACQ4PT_003521 [Festuca glaucescens]